VASRVVALGLVGLIEVYRRVLSPLTPARCRFVPSCSLYTADAIREFGAVKGVWLGIRRLLKCHPFHPGGFDPIPRRQ
jgi:putative membrane protein insertion efficiency factor